MRRKNEDDKIKHPFDKILVNYFSFLSPKQDVMNDINNSILFIINVGWCVFVAHVYLAANLIGIGGALEGILS